MMIFRCIHVKNRKKGIVPVHCIPFRAMSKMLSQTLYHLFSRYLEYFNVQNNKLSGPIPQEIWDLMHLGT